MSSQFSAFAPFGVFAFSSDESPCEQRYDELRNSLGEAFQGPVQDAMNYGVGMALGVAQLQLEAAASQRDPTQTTYLLPDLERDYQLAPLPTDSDNVRRAALAAVMAVTHGASRALVESGLTALLGADFIGCVWADLDEGAATFPATVPHINPVDTPIRHVAITGPTFPGERQVSYTAILTDGMPVKSGDWITIDPGALGLEETIQVTEATSSTFTATFANVHEPGAQATTAHWPHWGSTLRNTLVVVADSVLTNPRQLARIEWFMRRTMTGVSTWCVCTGSVASPDVFRVGIDRNVGYAPIGS